MTPEIIEKKQYLLHWMLDFIADEDEDEPAYHKSDVDECDKIITAFIQTVESSQQKNDIVWLYHQVEILVKQLNTLNAKLEYQLIESHQREDLCALVALVVKQAGHDYDGDMTEQWREW